MRQISIRGPTNPDPRHRRPRREIDPEGAHEDTRALLCRIGYYQTVVKWASAPSISSSACVTPGVGHGGRVSGTTGELIPYVDLLMHSTPVDRKSPPTNNLVQTAAQRPAVCGHGAETDVRLPIYPYRGLGSKAGVDFICTER